MNSSVLKRRENHVSALLGHCIVFFSGSVFPDAQRPHSLRSLCLYNPYTDRCLHHEITGEMEVPRTRQNTCAVNIGKDMFMFGGLDYTNFFPWYLNDVWKLKYDDDTDEPHNLQWEEVKVEPASATPSPRCGHNAWQYKDLLWTFGGMGPTPAQLVQGCLYDFGEFTYNDQGQNNQLFSFNPSIKQWINHDSRGATPCPRGGAAVAVLSSTLWLYGGETEVALSLNDLYQLNMDSITWTQVQMIGVKPPCLSDHTLNLLSEQCLLLCGESAAMMLKLFEPETVQLSELTLIPDRCRCRTSHTATTIGVNTIVIYGGYTYVNSTNDICVLFSNRMTLLHLATRMLYKQLDSFDLENIPVKIKKRLFFSDDSARQVVDVIFHQFAQTKAEALCSWLFAVVYKSMKADNKL